MEALLSKICQTDDLNEKLRIAASVSDEDLMCILYVRGLKGDTKAARLLYEYAGYTAGGDANA